MTSRRRCARSARFRWSAPAPAPSPRKASTTTPGVLRVEVGAAGAVQHRDGRLFVRAPLRATATLGACLVWRSSTTDRATCARPSAPLRPGRRGRRGDHRPQAALECRRSRRPRGRRVRRVHGRARGGRGRPDHRRRLAGGRPVLGICVGMQSCSTGASSTACAPRAAGEWPGTVERLDAPTSCRTWAGTPCARRRQSLFAGLDAETRFYFVHSYAVRKWELAGGPPPAGRWSPGPTTASLRRRGRERAAVSHPVPPGEVRRRRCHLLENWLATLSTEPGARLRPDGVDRA